MQIIIFLNLLLSGPVMVCYDLYFFPCIAPVRRKRRVMRVGMWVKAAF
ncbi:hypothetical protein NEILACOT_04550 [Neisseria lactamica ATCC 23970]|uniref:Uncharacterized protein n=1 Tax=Neisseria lactamica ATCC 23970 TaxID=546265 RepID=D0WAH9_NEILA|nr:hypothetical protein NEILACOT_04550 [Neisseria lactamica ATCC 23970]